MHKCAYETGKCSLTELCSNLGIGFNQVPQVQFLLYHVFPTQRLNIPYVYHKGLFSKQVLSAFPPSASNLSKMAAKPNDAVIKKMAAMTRHSPVRWRTAYELLSLQFEVRSLFTMNDIGVPYLHSYIIHLSQIYLDGTRRIQETG